MLQRRAYCLTGHPSQTRASQRPRGQIDLAEILHARSELLHVGPALLRRLERGADVAHEHAEALNVVLLRRLVLEYQPEHNLQPEQLATMLHSSR